MLVFGSGYCYYLVEIKDRASENDGTDVGSAGHKSQKWCTMNDAELHTAQQPSTATRLVLKENNPQVYVGVVAICVRVNSMKLLFQSTKKIRSSCSSIAPSFVNIVFKYNRSKK